MQTLGRDSEEYNATLLNGAVAVGSTCAGRVALCTTVVVLNGGFTCVASAIFDDAKSTTVSAIGYFFSPSLGGAQRFAVLTERRIIVFLHFLQKSKPKPSSFLGDKGMNKASFWRKSSRMMIGELC